MKKKVQTTLILSMIFLSANTFGQTNELQSEKIKDEKVTQTYFNVLVNAVTTNLNYGKLNNDLSDNKKSIFGVQVGASIQAGITPRFSLVSELYFIMKGGKLMENKLQNFNKTTLRFYTIESPVLARFNLCKFYVNAGPSIAYNLGGTRRIDDISKALSFNNSGESFKRLDAGIQMGAGYRFKIKQKNVVLDARYSYGLTNISNSREIYNRYLNINLTFTKLWKTNPLEKKRKS